MTPDGLVIEIKRVPSLLGPRSWGEAWWTACDLTITHPRSAFQEDLRVERELLGVRDRLRAAHEDRLFDEFLYGTSRPLTRLEEAS